MTTLHYILQQWLALLQALPGSSIRLANGLILVAVIFLPLERLFPLTRQRVFRRGFVRDIGYYFLNNLIPAMILVVPTALMVGMLHRYLPKSYLDWVAAQPFAARMVAAVIIGDLGSYWGHRWMHEIPFLWRFHSLHHSATKMDWLVNTYAHPLDMAFTRFCGIFLLYVVGLAQISPSQIDKVPVAFTLITSLWGYFIHANLRWRFGFLEQLVATPAFHHWHHTNDGPDKINKNYAANLPWLDRLFGTLYLPRDQRPETYGINEQMPDTMPAQLIKPFRGREADQST